MSYTAMTMPIKIWAIEGDNGFGFGEYNLGPHSGSTVYIRADIAEELARALEACPGSIGRKALARYREALAD